MNKNNLDKDILIQLQLLREEVRELKDLVILLKEINQEEKCCDKESSVDKTEKQFVEELLRRREVCDSLGLDEEQYAQLMSKQVVDKKDNLSKLYEEYVLNKRGVPNVSEIVSMYINLTPNDKKE